MNFSPALSSALEGPEWLRSLRRDAAASLDSTPFPDKTSELWRYSRVADIDLDRYKPADGVADDAGAEAERLMAVVGETAGTAVTVDGALVSGTGVVSEAFGFAGDPGTKGVDLFGVLNAAFVRDAVVVDVPAGKAIEKPVVVVNHLASNGVATFPRTLVRAGESSQVTVIELHTSADVDSFTAPVVDVQVGDNAHVTYVCVQLLGEGVKQVAYNVSNVGRDATFTSTTIALGGDYARVRTDSHLAGQGGTSYLRAVYFGTGTQMHDFRTLQAHDAPKSTSDLLFKGAIGDAARSVYSGLIRVTKGASGTNAFQTNRNLVLSDGAHAESVPNLEIEENDVKCSHASAVGPIDEDQRYYLESRGVAPQAAERLISLGFLDELISTIPSTGLAKLLRERIETKLARIIQA